MVKLGFHVSISGGIDKSVKRAKKLGCSTFQIFTRNPRSWGSRDLRDSEIEAFKANLRNTGIFPVFSHMPYILNLSSPEKDVYERSIASLKEEIHRCRKLDIRYIVTHLGSHLGTGKEEAFSRLINGLKRAMSDDTSNIMILLENTAGSENQIGSTLDDFKILFDDLNSDNYGMCFDTCHAYAAGMNLRSFEGLEEIINSFDKGIGFDRLKLIHLNDSVGEIGSHYDKHEHIGLGKIGERGFKRILNSELVQNKSIIMETPQNDIRSDLDNLKYVKKLIRK